MTSKDTLTTGAFWSAAALRAVRTFAQTLIVLAAGDGANLISGSTLDWAITALGAAALSVLTSIVAGIPEVTTRENTPRLDST